MTSSGRLFQILGPAEANGRSPIVTSRDGAIIVITQISNGCATAKEKAVFQYESLSV